MQVRPGGAPGHAHQPQRLALRHAVALGYHQFAAMEEGAVQPHAVIDHQQIALQREGVIGGEDHHPIGGRAKGGAGGQGDVQPRMIGARDGLAIGAAIDALGAE